MKAAARSVVSSAGRHLRAEMTDSRWAWGWTLYQHLTGGTDEVLELYGEHPLTCTSFPDLGLALVKAYLGSEEEAVRLADEGVRLDPVSRNVFGGPDRVLWQAHVYTVVGRHDDAVIRLRYRLSIPANMVTVPQLRMDLRWDPLRNHPGFQALLRKDSG